MTTSLSFCLAPRRRVRFLHRFVFACLICVGGCGRFSVHRNYCGGKPEQRAGSWVSLRAPGKPGGFGGQRCWWGAPGGGRAAMGHPRGSEDAAGMVCFPQDRPCLPPSPGSGAGCPCPILANPIFASHARPEREGSGGRGWREEGQPLAEPSHPLQWNGNTQQRQFFHQGTQEGAAAHVCQTLRSSGTTACTRESSRTFLSTQGGVRALRRCVLCSCPLSPLPVRWRARRGRFAGCR